VLGTVAYFVALSAGTGLVLKLGARDGILLPLMVGLALRAGVMLAAHLVSVGGGEHGFLYVDDIGYADDGRLLAAHWSHLQFVNPVGFAYAGSYEAAFPTLVGVVFTLLGGESLLAVKAVNVLLGTGTVLLGTLVVATVFGPGAQRRAAWILALAPGLIWWSAPMIKEALVGFLVMAATLTCLRARSLSPLMLAGLLIAATVFSRATAAIAVFVAAAAVMVGLLVHHRHRVNLGRDSALAVPVLTLVLGALVVSHGRPGYAASSLAHTAENMFRTYQGGNLGHLPVDVLKSWVSPYPWIFTAATHTWDRALYPDMWVLYAAAPTVIYGAWRLRHSPEGWFVILVIVVFSIANSAASGFVFRQRSSAEALLVVPCIAGLRVPRLAARLAAASVGLVALPAGLHERSAIITLVILAAAAAVALASRLLPEAVLDDTDPLESGWNGVLLTKDDLSLEPST
jgi:hypothetical protein